MIIKSPASLAITPPHSFRIFLAGSIEMGTAVNWQEQIENAFGGKDNIVLLNPRRDDWDRSWIQEISNPAFKEQVDWELNAMEAADLIIMYFSPDTKSPITLLELGLHAKSEKLLVCCPKGFWRKGNVDIICKRYDIPAVMNMEELIKSIHQKINH